MNSNKSRLTTLLLALFFGAFGAHRFYVGKNGTAFAQLFLTMTIVGALFSGIWAFFDVCLIAGGAFKDKENQSVKHW